MEIEGVIFDLDGTVYNKRGLKYYFILGFFNRLKLLTALLKIRKGIEGIEFKNQDEFNNRVLSDLVALSSKPVEQCQQFMQQFMLRFVKILGRRYKAEKQIVDAIDHCYNKGVKLVCLSDYTKVKERLVALDIEVDKFDLLKSSEEYGALKPSPKSFLAIASTLGIAPAKIVVVGDRDDTDGEGARNSGMQFIKYPENINTLKSLLND